MQLVSYPSSQISIENTDSAGDKVCGRLCLIKRKSPRGKQGQVRFFLLKHWSQIPLPDRQYPQWLNANTQSGTSWPLLTRETTNRVSKASLSKGWRGWTDPSATSLFPTPSPITTTFHHVSFQETGTQAGTQRHFKWFMIWNLAGTLPYCFTTWDKGFKEAATELSSATLCSLRLVLLTILYSSFNKRQEQFSQITLGLETKGILSIVINAPKTTSHFFLRPRLAPPPLAPLPMAKLSTQTQKVS